MNISSRCDYATWAVVELARRAQSDVSYLATAIAKEPAPPALPPVAPPPPPDNDIAPLAKALFADAEALLLKTKSTVARQKALRLLDRVLRWEPKYLPAAKQPAASNESPRHPRPASRYAARTSPQRRAQPPQPPQLPPAPPTTIDHVQPSTEGPPDEEPGA